MKKIGITGLLVAGLGLTATAQQMLGVATSNWSGTTSMLLNPANIGDSRQRFVLDLVSLNFGADNNVGSIQNLNKVFQGNGVSNFGDIFTMSGNKSLNLLIPTLDLRLPGIMVSIDDKNSIALTSRVRGVLQFNNFDRQLLDAALSPGDVNSDIAINSQNFNWTTHIWSEIKLTYAREVYNEGEHYLKAGVSLTRLGGIGFLSLKGSNLDGHYYKAPDSLYTRNTDIEFATSVVDDANSLKSGLGSVANDFFGSKSGHGFGGGFGVVYEYRPEGTNNDDKSGNKYKARVSAAVNDLGSIKYDALQATVHANGYVKGSELSRTFKDYHDFTNYFVTHGYTLDTGKAATKVHMPSNLTLSVDYFVTSHLYVNAIWIKNLANRDNYGNSLYSQFTVTPRWDTRFFSVGLPITYSALSGSMKAGLGVRLGGLIFGSDDMLALVGGKAYGVNFYVGGYIPINKKHGKSNKD